MAAAAAEAAGVPIGPLACCARRQWACPRGIARQRLLGRVRRRRMGGLLLGVACGLLVSPPLLASRLLRSPSTSTASSACRRKLPANLCVAPCPGGSRTSEGRSGAGLLVLGKQNRSRNRSGRSTAAAEARCTERPRRGAGSRSEWGAAAVVRRAEEVAAAAAGSVRPPPQHLDRGVPTRMTPVRSCPRTQLLCGEPAEPVAGPAVGRTCAPGADLQLRRSNGDRRRRGCGTGATQPRLRRGRVDGWGSAGSVQLLAAAAAHAPHCMAQPGTPWRHTAAAAVPVELARRGGDEAVPSCDKAAPSVHQASVRCWPPLPPPCAMLRLRLPRCCCGRGSILTRNQKSRPLRTRP
jgi:hypothetical protein